MCGFVGGTDPSWDYAAGLKSIEHRGPDDGRLHLDSPISVGFRRLSIIDLDAGAHQPMFSDDGQSWLVFNGEIYGFLELRKELQSRGRAFRTHSDTEVVLQAYFEWGDDFIEQIDGMFAIVIWDARETKLKLYRDRPGIKPLYYFYDGSRFAFASELKALRCAIDPADLQVDNTAVYDFLGYRYIPGPKTLYRNCFQLLPAHRLIFEPASGKLGGPQPYWTLPIPDSPREMTADEAAEELRVLIDNSVRQQMISDVPLGFFLSGGVDSSIIVASAASMTSDISTFSIGFDSGAPSETAYARVVADMFGTDHHERTLSREDAGELLPSMKSWFDEPYAGESAMPTYLVSKVARENVTVVLTGDGGDEVFGGYKTYPRFERYDRMPSLPAFTEGLTHRLRALFGRNGSMARVTNLIEMALSGGPRLWGKIMSRIPEFERRRYRSQFEIPADYDDWWHYRLHWREDLPTRTCLQVVDFHTYMPAYVLTKVDRTSMAVSLEARVPLLDRRIIEFAFSLPEEVRFYNGEAKGLLRHAYRGVLPDRILDRRKRGFGVPKRYLKGMTTDKTIEHQILEMHGIV